MHDRKENKYLIITCIIFLIFSVSRAGAQSNSGKIQGSFVVEEETGNRSADSGSRTGQTGSPGQTDVRNSGTGTTQSTGQSGTTQANTTGNSAGSTGDNRSRQSGSSNVSRPVTTQERNSQIQGGATAPPQSPVKDDVSYKKIYFTIIAAVVLFLYLIIGLRRRRRGKRKNKKTRFRSL